MRVSAISVGEHWLNLFLAKRGLNFDFSETWSASRGKWKSKERSMSIMRSVASAVGTALKYVAKAVGRAAVGTVR